MIGKGRPSRGCCPWRHLCLTLSTVARTPSRLGLRHYLGRIRAANGALRNRPWLRNVWQTLWARAAIVIVGGTSSILVARVLGPVGRGFYATAGAAGTTLAVFGTLGLHAANVYYVGRYPQRRTALVWNSVVVALVVAFVAATSYAVFDSVMPSALPVRGSLGLAVLSWVPFALAFAILQPLLLAVGEVRLYSVVDLSWQLAGLLLVSLLAGTGHATPATLWSTNTLAIAGAAAVIVRRLVRGTTQVQRPSMEVFRSTVRYASRTYMSSISGFLLLRIDILIMAQLLGARQVGYYSVASTAADLVLVVPAVIGALLFPRLCALVSDAERLRATRRVMAGTICCMTVLCLSMLVAAPDVVRVVFGRQYVPAVPAINLLLPGLVFYGGYFVAINFFFSVGMPIVVVGAQTFCLGINVTLDLLLLPRLGIAGASIASSVAYTLMFVAALILMHRREFRRGVEPEVGGKSAVLW